MDGSQVAASELPPDTRALAELLGERVDLALGLSRLELMYQDGQLTHLWRHEKIGAGALAARFNPFPLSSPDQQPDPQRPQSEGF